MEPLFLTASINGFSLWGLVALVSLHSCNTYICRRSEPGTGSLVGHFLLGGLLWDMVAMPPLSCAITQLRRLYHAVRKLPTIDSQDGASTQGYGWAHIPRSLRPNWPPTSMACWQQSRKEDI